MDDLAIDDDDEDDDDSDYEYMGGDMSLYESKLDEFDELQHLKRILITLEGNNSQLYKRLLSGFSDQSVLENFKNILGDIENLISKEATVK